MPIMAIDPGTTQSGFVVLDAGRLMCGLTVPNSELVERLATRSEDIDVVIEMIASYGMAVGKETFETCVWIGRFIEASRNVGRPANRLFRKDIKLHLCGTTRAKDSNIRQALIDRYGPGKEAAIGKKASPGPLYRITGHQFAALAVGVCWHDGVRSEGL